jgi:hypothetical protein
MGEITIRQPQVTPDELLRAEIISFAPAVEAVAIIPLFASGKCRLKLAYGI